MNRDQTASKASQILLTGAVVLICFAAGVLSVLATRDQPGAGPTAGSPEANGAPREAFLSPVEADQFLLLILGVDRLSPQEPRLEAIWYATYRPPGTEVFLYGLPLSWRSPKSGSQAARELYDWSRLEGVSKQFLDALPMAPDAVLVMDQAAFVQLINFVGGVEVDGAHLDGAEAIELLEGVEAQPNEHLNMQARLLSELAARSLQLGDTPDLTTLMGQIPEHAYTSIPAADLVSNLSPLLPLKQADFHIQLLLQD